MMKSIKYLIVVLTIVLIASGCTIEANINLKENDKEIVILYTNDTHCGVEDGIGFAGVASLKQEVAKAGDYVALIDAGDAIQGATIGTLTEGEDIIEIMNLVGYDLAVPGNHEFDYKMERFFELKGKADFTYLSCNIKNIKTDEYLLDAYKILEFGEFKVAFVGITTPETLTSSSPVRFKDENGEVIYDFARGDNGNELYGLVQTAVDSALDAGADYVVAIGHLGNEKQAQPWTSVDVIENTVGIDVMIDGHSHDEVALRHVKNKEGDTVLLTQTGTKLANIGKIVITKDGNISTELISGYDKKDEAVANKIAEITDTFKDKLGEVIGYSDYDLPNVDPEDGKTKIVRMREMAIGDYVADAFKDYFGAEIGLMNGGGVKTSIKKGNVTYGNMSELMPYGNKAIMIEATGNQILDLIEFGTVELPAESSGILQVSGLTFDIDLSVESHVIKDENGKFVKVDGEYRVKNLKVNGEDIDLTRTYTVASTDYILVPNGGARAMLEGCKVINNPGVTDMEVLIDYMKLNGVSEKYSNPYGEGRFNLINGQ